MRIVVEPEHGHELDRLITALLNATGVVHQAIERTEHPPGARGVEVVGLVADRLRGALALLAELRSDEELDLATQVLAEATLLVAGELGLEGTFAGLASAQRGTRILNVKRSPPDPWATVTVPRAPAKRPVPPVIAWS